MPVVTTSRHISRKPQKKLIILCLSAVVFSALIFIYKISKTSESNVNVTLPPDIQDVPVRSVTDAPRHVAPAITVSAATQSAATQSTVTKSTASAVAPSSVTTNDYVKKAGQMQLPNGKILTFPPPAPGKTRKVAAYGHIYECDSEGNWNDITPRKLFDTAFENQFIGLAVEGGSFIPETLIGLDQNDVIQLLQKPVVMNGDETEVEAMKKNAVAEMKMVALDYIEQGGTFDEFVAEIASSVKQERELKAKGLRKIMTLYKEGKIDEAKQYTESFNAAASTQGFMPIRLPAHVRAAFGEKQQAESGVQK